MNLEEALQCPSCKFESQEAFTYCPMCGLVIQKYYARLANEEADLAARRKKMELHKIDMEKRKEELNQPVRCPKCTSNQIHYEKKGYGIGKGLIGLATIGPLGLAAGAIGKDKLLSICVKCGHKW